MKLTAFIKFTLLCGFSGFIALTAQADPLIKKFDLVDTKWAENCLDNKQPYVTYEGALLSKNTVTTYGNNEKYAIGKTAKIEELKPDPKTGWDRVKVMTKLKVLKTNEEATNNVTFIYNPDHSKRRVIEMFNIEKNRPLVVDTKNIFYDNDGNEIKPPNGPVLTKIQNRCN
jgi:hypothetical protein